MRIDEAINILENEINNLSDEDLDMYDDWKAQEVLICAVKSLRAENKKLKKQLSEVAK